ncbi:MAG: bis(5'-nucleosyl)-tetraphosphatase (symmetrical) YqeK [Anaerovoracaceae bacterium]
MDCNFEKLKNEIEDYINRELKPKRLKHTYGVADEAKKLASLYGADVQKAELASLFHDMFRSAPVETLNKYVTKLGLPNKFIDNPNLSHGKIAAEIMKDKFGIEDEELIDAVAYHTTGRAGMSLLEKIIFLADAIEPGRDYPGVEETRKLAYIDLDRACMDVMNRSIEFIKSKGDKLDKDTVNAREDLKEKLNL